MASKVNNVISYVKIASNGNTAIAASAYGICETPAATVAKVVDMSGFVLTEGVSIHVKFTYSNTAANPTLNVNGTGAKAIKRYGTTNVGTTEYTSWKAGSIISLTYDGTNWIIDDFLGIDENHIHSFTSEDKFINSVGVTYNNLMFSLSSKSLNVSRVISDAIVSTTESYVTGYTGIGMELYTVSGDIVTFTTSSENAIKELEISIVATQSGSGDPSPENERPISGWADANVQRARENLFPYKDVESQTKNGVTFTVEKSNGVITNIHMQGTATSNTSFSFATSDESWTLPKGNFKLYIGGDKPTQSRTFDINVRKAGTTSDIVASFNETTISLSEQTTFKSAYIWIYSGMTVNHDIIPVIVRDGADTSVKYPITQRQSVNIHLGQTVYGGTLDVKTGELTVTIQGIHKTLSQGTAHTPSSGFIQYDFAFENQSTSASSSDNKLCSIAPYGYHNILITHFYILSDGRMILLVPEDTPTSLEFDAICPLETPITYQLTPTEIRSLLGINNIWADCGAITELKYTTIDESPSNKELEFGVRVDFDSSTSTRLKDAAGLSAGQDFDNFTPWQRKRCILDDGGHVLAYYGENGYTETGSLTQAITKNGTTYPIGTSVQVMVEQQPFWYKVVPISLTPNTDSGIGYHTKSAEYYISPTPRSGYKLHPAFYGMARPIYLSACEGSYYDSGLSKMFDDDSDTSTTINANDKLCSIGNNQKPISGLRKNLSKPNCELLASRRGNGWHLESIQVYMMNIFLSMVEFATFNSQNSLGAGVTSITDNSSYNCSSLTGSTSSLGNASGQASSTVNRIGSTTTTYTTGGKVSVSYRGQENPYGNIWKHIQSINFWGDGTMCGGQAYVNNTLSDFNESIKDGVYVATNITLANSSGYAKYIGYSPDYDWLFLISKTGDGASTSTIIGDDIYVTANLNAYRIALMGGAWNNGGSAGSLYWFGAYGVGNRSRTVGGRLMYIPSSS